MIPSRKNEIKKKDDENAKKDLLRQEIETKIALSKLITRRRKIVQRLDAISEQCRFNRSILTDVCQDVEALGHDASRLSQLLAVYEKIEIVLHQETAKI